MASIDEKINDLPEQELRDFRDALINYVASRLGQPDERGYNLSEKTLLKLKTKVYKMLFPDNNEPCLSN